MSELYIARLQNESLSFLDHQRQSNQSSCIMRTESQLPNATPESVILQGKSGDSAIRCHSESCEQKPDVIQDFTPAGRGTVVMD